MKVHGLKRVGSVMIVNEELMVRVPPPVGPPESRGVLSFLQYVSPTEIHRYTGKDERFLRDGNGLTFDGSPHIIEYDPDRSYFPADGARKEEIFAKRKKQLDSAGLHPVLNYII